MTLRVIAFTPQPPAGASSRYRIYQMAEPLAREGITLDARPFLDDAGFARLYESGRRGTKALDLARGAMRRWTEVEAAGRYDLGLIHRELWPLAGNFLLRRFETRQRRWAFDFDDAVFLPNVSEANRAFVGVKAHHSAPALAAGATAVSAGNRWLAEWARAQRSSRPPDEVSVVPTAIDLEHWQPRNRAPGGPRLVWIGSRTTVAYLEPLRPVLERLSRRWPDLELHCIGAPFSSTGVKCIEHPWSEDTEVELVARCDVGLAPLPNTDWGRGKCGLKLLLYMALGLPVVASAAGVHYDIVSHGMNGFLAESADEFESALDRLLGDADLRARIGRAAVATVEAGYSIRSVAPKLASVLRRAAETGPS